MFGVHSRKGGSFTLMKMFWEKPQNQYKAHSGGENEERIILFLTRSNQVAQCFTRLAKQLLGWVVNVIKNSAAHCNSAHFCVIDVPSLVSALQWKFPLRLDWKQSILHSFLLIKQPAGMFYYAVPAHCRNPQFKVFLSINEQRVNFITSGLQSVRSLMKDNNSNILESTWSRGLMFVFETN